MKARLIRTSIGSIVGLALVAGIIWLLTLTLGTSETKYEGKTFYHWLEALTNQDVVLSNNASRVVQTLIIPDLVQTMFGDLNDSKLRVALIDKLNNLPGVNIYFIPADGRRAYAAGNLGQLGGQAKPAISELMKALKGTDRAVRPSAARSLGQIQSDPEVIIPLLIGYLSDSQDDVPEAAVEGLANFGTLSKPAVPKLLEMLKIPDKDLQVAVRAALKKIDPQAAAQAGIR